MKTATVSLETCQPAKIMPSYVITEFIAQCIGLIYSQKIIYKKEKVIRRKINLPYLFCNTYLFKNKHMIYKIKQMYLNEGA